MCVREDFGFENLKELRLEDLTDEPKSSCGTKPMRKRVNNTEAKQQCQSNQ
jgi:hypothetical protein